MAVRRPRGASADRLKSIGSELAYVERQLAETVSAVAALRERINAVLISDIHHAREQALVFSLEDILGPRTPLTLAEKEILRRLLAVFTNNPKATGP